MLGRCFGHILAVGLVLGAALPASAGETVIRLPAPETLSLLMQDDRATFVAIPSLPLLMMDVRATWSAVPSASVSPIAPGPARPMLSLPQMRGYALREAGMGPIAASPARVTLSGFDALEVSPAAYRPARWTELEPSTLSAETVAHPGSRERVFSRHFAEVTASNGGGYAVREGTSWITRRRPPRVLDASVIFHIDGRPESPVWSVGGGVAASIWQAIPRD